MSQSLPFALIHCHTKPKSKWKLFTIFPPNLLSPLIILHSNTFLPISNTLNQVPLHHPFDASRHPIFNSKSASESELETNGFRYCTVYHLYSFISYNLPT